MIFSGSRSSLLFGLFELSEPVNKVVVFVLEHGVEDFIFRFFNLLVQ